MFSLKRQVGNTAEDIAENYLKKRGLCTIMRNFASKCGEIDLIMLDDGILAFIEVRYRKSADFGTALATITYNKQQKIIRTAQIFLQKYPEYQHFICRFDAIGLSGSLKYPTIDYLPHAFAI